MSNWMGADGESVVASVRGTVDSAFAFISTAILFFLVVIVVIQVLTRIMSVPESQFSTSWIRPVSQYLLIIGTYLGGVVATSGNEHIRLGVTQDYLEDNHPKLSTISNIVSKISVIITLGVVLLATSLATLDGWTAVFGSVQFIKVGYIYLLMTIGVLFMIIFEFEKLYMVVMNAY